MALTWELGEIVNWKDACRNEDGTLSGITDCLIWATLMVDMGHITQSNAKAFFRRLHAWETAVGPIRSDGQRISFNDVVRHIGLRTNVTQRTEADFRKKIMASLYERANRAIAEKETDQ